MLRNKTFLKIFSLFSAVLLWVYVMGEVDPETKEVIREIPVHFTNTDVLAENDLAVVQEEVFTISATIEGRRSEVNDVKKAGLTAYIDVSDCSKGRNTGKVIVNVPEGLSLEAVSSSTYKFRVEELVEKQKPVVIEFTDTVNGTDKMAWVLETDPETITVRGANSSVESIVSLKGSVSANKASTGESRWVSVDVVPVTADGTQVLGVTPEEAKVKAKIQLLSVKTVGLEVTTDDSEISGQVEKIETVKNIKIVGPADVVDDLDKIEGTVDLTGMTGTTEVAVLLTLPENVFLLNEKNWPMAEVTMKSAQ